ncbi:hypothetical protein MKZ38_004291 [Zalerion maritima]|uniref:Survival protein SurE-like phosphatase/nucleotidase domain-containing protein n=1 Tax=Zalerion maritima TaxID=339359 RepID=A0AAD5RMK0_9PEZI|nr:hypothetical protein MKZ38_004291 [Zalerion maritima]
MHILLTNDDGPPSSHSSPYVLTLVRELQKAGHTVSVCLPHTQRSWIGKAHIIGQTVKPIYYRPPPAPITSLDEDAPQGTTHHRPSPSVDVEEWVLVDGTPASCVQIGLYHFFGQESSSNSSSGNGKKELPPIDLVLSGPNYGRNTTAVFALSSGTLGGALEAAICRKKSIALSFAFFTRNHDPLVINAACRHSVKVVEKLYKQWPEDGTVDLYSVNVPLVEGVEGHKTIWTSMLQNYWKRDGCFMEVEGSVGDEEEEEERIREGVDGEVSGGSAVAAGHKHRHFKWAPRFGDVYKSVEQAGPGNDGWTVKEGQTSVTPLKANFCQAAEHLHNQELELELPVGQQQEEHLVNSSEQHIAQILDLQSNNTHKLQQHADNQTAEMAALNSQTQETTVPTHDKPHIYAIIDYQDSYVQPLLLSALKTLVPQSQLTFVPLSTIWDPSGTSDPSLSAAIPSHIPSSSPSSAESPTQILQITPYEALDFSFAHSYPRSYTVNSYMLRKAVIRKHYLASTVANWVAKRPGSVLKNHVKVAEGFEVDYAEFLDDALVECWDLRTSLGRNEQLEVENLSQLEEEDMEAKDQEGFNRQEPEKFDVEEEQVLEKQEPKAQNQENGKEQGRSSSFSGLGTATEEEPGKEKGCGLDTTAREVRQPTINTTGNALQEDGAVGMTRQHSGPSVPSNDGAVTCPIAPQDDDVLRPSVELLQQQLQEQEEQQQFSSKSQPGIAPEEDVEKLQEELQNQKEWWILKPSMSDRGQGIKLFSTMEELQIIFDDWETGLSDDESGGEGDRADEDAENGTKAHSNSSKGVLPAVQQVTEASDAEFDADHDDNITAAHLRHFVAQPYIHPPLLVPGDNRKFHIRTYVLCMGSLQVYVYKPMLILFAAKAYLPPWECTATSGGSGDIENFLTNTCLQGNNVDKSPLVGHFWDSRLSGDQKADIFGQICAVTGELFEAAAKGMMMHFQPMENAFEVFGLDFLVDDRETAWLLEVNSFPDFKQTGGDLGWIVAELWKEVLSLVVTPLVPGLSGKSIPGELSEGQSVDDEKSEVKAGSIPAAEGDGSSHPRLVFVRQVDLGRRFTTTG